MYSKKTTSADSRDLRHNEGKMAKNLDSEDSKLDIENIRMAIRNLESPKNKRERERAQLFSNVYPDICDKLREGVSRSLIIKALAELGISLSNAAFDRLLAAEAERRGESVPGNNEDGGEDLSSLTSIPRQMLGASAKEEVTR